MVCTFLAIALGINRLTAGPIVGTHQPALRCIFFGLFVSIIDMQYRGGYSKYYLEAFLYDEFLGRINLYLGQIGSDGTGLISQNEKYFLEVMS